MAGHRSVIWREGGRNGGGLLIKTAEHRRGDFPSYMCAKSKEEEATFMLPHKMARGEEERGFAQKRRRKKSF